MKRQAIDVFCLLHVIFTFFIMEIQFCEVNIHNFVQTASN